MTATAQPAQPIQTTVPESNTERILSALNRCDQCRAQARHRVTMADDGGYFYFCAHHGNEHIDTLLPMCSQWIDESRFVIAQSDASA